MRRRRHPRQPATKFPHSKRELPCRAIRVGRTQTELAAKKRTACHVLRQPSVVILPLSNCPAVNPWRTSPRENPTSVVANGRKTSVPTSVLNMGRRAPRSPVRCLVPANSCILTRQSVGAPNFHQLRTGMRCHQRAASTRAAKMKRPSMRCPNPWDCERCHSRLPSPRS